VHWEQGALCANARDGLVWSCGQCFVGATLILNATVDVGRRRGGVVGRTTWRGPPDLAGGGRVWGKRIMRGGASAVLLCAGDAPPLGVYQGSVPLR
jgi:hypothetical protein